MKSLLLVCCHAEGGVFGKILPLYLAYGPFILCCERCCSANFQWFFSVGITPNVVVDLMFLWEEVR